MALPPKPSAPTVPTPALRSNPDTFSADAESNILFFNDMVTYSDEVLGYFEIAYDLRVVYDDHADFVASTEPSRGIGSIWRYGLDSGEEVASGGDVINSATTPVHLKILAGEGGTLSLTALGAERIDPTAVTAGGATGNGVLVASVADNAAIIAAGVALAKANQWRINDEGFYYSSDKSVYRDLYSHRKGPTDNNGQKTHGVKWPYSAGIASGGLVTDYTTSNIPLVFEDGDLLIRITYTGFLNGVDVQLRESTLLRDTITNYTNGETNAPDRFKRSFNADGLEKQILLKIPVDGVNWFDKNADRIRMVFQTNVADRTVDAGDVEFEVTAVDYSWHNTKNVYERDAVNPLGYKGFAMRNEIDAGGVGSRILAAPSSVATAMSNIAEYKNQTDADFIRWPIQFKGAIDHGDGTTHEPDLGWINRAVQILDHCASINLNVMLCLNHSFDALSTFVTEEWIRAEDIDTPTKRQNRADDAARVLQYIVDHPAIKLIELDNEVDVYQLGHAHDAADGTTAVELVDYYQKMAVAIKDVTKKPLSLSFGGYRWSNFQITSLFGSYIDFFDIHPYSTNRGGLLGIDNQVIMSESNPQVLDSDDDVRWRSENVCIWADTLNPDGVIGGDFGYDAGNELLYRGVSKLPSLPFTSFSQAWVWGVSTLASVTPNDLVPSVMYGQETIKYWNYNAVTSAWEAANVYTVANLPSSAEVGDRAFVTDATAAVFNATLTGGGSTDIPVFYTGSVWRTG